MNIFKIQLKVKNAMYFFLLQNDIIETIFYISYIKHNIHATKGIELYYIFYALHCFF